MPIVVVVGGGRSTQSNRGSICCNNASLVLRLATVNLRKGSRLDGPRRVDRRGRRLLPEAGRRTLRERRQTTGLSYTLSCMHRGRGIALIGAARTATDRIRWPQRAKETTDKQRFVLLGIL
jgi:hypothetical protein